MSAKLTRGGVTYDLGVSPFTHTETYKNGYDLTFMFSSEFNKDRFLERMKENREKINSSLTKRFNMNIEFSVLADVKLYSTVEKRGFHIKSNESITCLNTIELSGETLIVKS